MKANYTAVINGCDIQITVRSHTTRFGTVFTASNDYGEPRDRVTGYKSALEAAEAEIAELKQLLS